MQQSAVGGEIDEGFGGGLLLGRRSRARSNDGAQRSWRRPSGTTTTATSATEERWWWLRILFVRTATAVVVHNLLLEDVHVVDVLQERLVRGQDLNRFDVLLQLFHVPLELGPAVLEPGYHLRGERVKRNSIGLEYGNSFFWINYK